MKQLTSRQVGIIIFLSILSLKLLIMPSFIYTISKNSSYISIFINLFSDFLTLFAYFIFMKKYPNTTFKTALEQCFGKWIARIIFSALAIYFFVKAFLTVKQIQNYFNRIIFDDFGWLDYIFPSIVLLIYLSTKNFKTFGRASECLIFFALISTFLLVILNVSSVNLSELLPFFKNGVQPILDSSFKTTFGFGDYAFLLLFLGKIKIEKNTKRTIIFYSVLAGLMVLVFYILFMSTFGNYSINKNIALSDLSLNQAIPLTVGRLDWINILIWSFILFFNAGLLLASCKECLFVAFSTQKQPVVLSLIYSVFLAFVIYKELSLSFMLKIVSSVPFQIFSFFIQSGLPTLIVLCGIILKKKNFSDRKVLYISKFTPKKFAGELKWFLY